MPIATLANKEKREEKKLQMFDRNVLRTIYEPCFDQNTQEWGKRDNKELEDLFKIPLIVNEIIRSRLERADRRKKNSTT